MSTTRRSFLHRLGGGAAMAALAAAHDAIGDELDPPSPEVIKYTLRPGLTYLNHASIGTAPEVVQRAQRDYLRICETYPSHYVWGPAWDRAREEVRRLLADYVGCPYEDVAITHNTTEGFNLLANRLPLGPGDEVLFGSMNHVGASACFEHVGRQRGYGTRRFEIPIERVGTMSHADIVELYATHITPATRLLVMPHVDNLVGVRHPIADIAAMARSKGVEFIAVDGAQSIGMIPVNIAQLGIDVYSSSPHKWLQAPKGLGLLYVRPELRKTMEPLWVTWGQPRWQGTARVYEDYGTRDLAAVLALGAAVTLHRSIPWFMRNNRLRALFDHALAQSRVRNLHWLSPTAWSRGGSLYTLELPQHEADAVLTQLTRSDIAARVFAAPSGCRVRISPNMANTTADIDRLLDALSL